MSLLTVKKIHKYILQKKLKWIRNIEGLTEKEIRILYTEQLRNGSIRFKNEEIEAMLSEPEPVLGATKQW